MANRSARELTLETGSPFTEVPIEVIVTVGRANPSVGDLLRLRPDDVLSLDRRISDPVELYVGDRLIARGELEEVGGEGSGQLAVRLTEVAGGIGET
jgi:flagellar motor switch protein FliN/FliY